MSFQPATPYRPPWGWGEPVSAGLTPTEYFRLCKLGKMNPDTDYKTASQMELINSLRKHRRGYIKKNIRLDIGRNEHNLGGYVKVYDDAQSFKEQAVTELSEYDMQDEARIATRCMMALIQFGCTEEEAFSYMNNMRVTSYTQAEEPLPPIIKYDPIPVYILWMLASIPYSDDETLSAHIITLNALERKEAIDNLSSMTKQEVTEHYRKYGTVAEKSWAYLNSFFKVWK